MPFYFLFISYLADILVETYVANPKGNKPRRNPVNRELELSSPQTSRYKPAPEESDTTGGKNQIYGCKTNTWDKKKSFKMLNRLHDIFKLMSQILFWFDLTQ